MVRVRPETYELLAALRRPLVDSDGHQVAFESFDRTLRRLLDEHRTVDPTSERFEEVEP